MRKLTYIWIDGSTPDSLLRSKIKITADDVEVDPPRWGFDGSSTHQAQGDSSDCVLVPVFACQDPLSDPESINGDQLVFCEVYTPELEPHNSNMRKSTAELLSKYTHHEVLVGFEQEYTLFKDKRPLGFPPKGDPPPQGKYYCGVGFDRAFGRQVAEEHLDMCLKAGLEIGGINAEVMPGQWEFQIGPIDPLYAADQLWTARWLLHRVAERHGVTVSFDPKPLKGDWNGAGCHTNISTQEMRDSYKSCIDACKALEKYHSLHIQHYGDGIRKRLTGLHETCKYDEFKYGVSDRSASVRIPWQVAKDEKGGYIEDRRPNANCDPYVVVGLIVKAICV